MVIDEGLEERALALCTGRTGTLFSPSLTAFAFDLADACADSDEDDPEVSVLCD
jgi:hypothetical protein